MSHRDYLFSLEHLGIKLGLEQIRALVAALDYPDRSFASIVIAGTNGKGSVTAMVERGLRAAGYRTGRFTSPHLVDLEERFVIDGRQIDRGALERYAGDVRAAAAHLPAPPSFFEATTALALAAFRGEGVAAAVLEVGLGGRLDATNVVTPVGVAITAIDFDHEAYLGNTLPAIAGEKAGVIKRGAVVVVSDNPPDVIGVFRLACSRTGTALVVASDGTFTDAVVEDGRTRLTVKTPRADYGEITLALRGRHQIGNAVTAVRLLEELDAAGVFAIAPETIRIALEDVVWPARLEMIEWEGTRVLLDGAHNPAGARALCDYILETYGRPIPLVIGIMGDKKIEAMLRALMPCAGAFVFTQASSPRAASASKLAAIARGLVTVPIDDCADPIEALRRARRFNRTIVAAGSLYLAGEIRAQIA